MDMSVGELMDKLYEAGVRISYERPRFFIKFLDYNDKLDSQDLQDEVEEFIWMASGGRLCSSVYYSEKHNFTAYVSLRSGMLKADFDEKDLEGYLNRNPALVARIMKDLDESSS